MNWTRVSDRLPDDDMLVLVALADGEVWPAYLDGDKWRYVTSDLIDESTVTHWMEMPAAPVEEAA